MTAAVEPSPMTPFDGCVTSENSRPLACCGDVAALQRCVHVPDSSTHPVQVATVSQVTRLPSTTPMGRSAPQGARLWAPFDLSTMMPPIRSWVSVAMGPGALTAPALGERGPVVVQTVTGSFPEMS